MESAERGLSHILGWEVEGELTDFVSQEGFKGRTTSDGSTAPAGANGATSSPVPLASPEISMADNGPAKPRARAEPPAPAPIPVPTPGRQRSGTDSTAFRSGLAPPHTGNGYTPSIASERDHDDGSNTINEKSGKKKGGFLSALRGNKLDRRKSTSQGASLKGSQGAGGGATSPPPVPPMMSPDDEEAFSRPGRPTGAGRTLSEEEFGGSNDGRGGGSSSLRPDGLKNRKSNRDSFMPSFSSLGLKRKGEKGSKATEVPLTGPLTGARTRDDDYRRATEASAMSAREREEADLERALRESRQEMERGQQTGLSSNANANVQSPLDEDVPPLGTQSIRGTGQGMETIAPTSTPSTMHRPFSEGRERSNSNNPFAASMSSASADRPAAPSVTSDGHQQAPEADLMSLNDDDVASDAGTQPSGQPLRSLAIQPASSNQESEADREAAMLKLKNTLLSSAPGGGSGSGSVNRRATRLGPGRERASRQSTISSSTSGAGPAAVSAAYPAANSSEELPVSQILELHKQQTGTSISGQNAAPSVTSPIDHFSTPVASGFSASSRPTSPLGGMAHRAIPDRAGSVLSTASSQQGSLSRGTGAAVGSVGFSQPQGHGIRAAVLETVNVMFKNGKVTALKVTGEIGLTAKSLDANHQLRIRIAGSDSLERSSPNHSILTPVGGRSDEFTIDTAALQTASATAGSITTIFKYQVRTEGTDMRLLVPIEIAPQWKLEPHQTSFIMTYNGNPDCRFSTGESAASADDPFGGGDEVGPTAPPVLHDVTISVLTPGGLVTGTLQTKPEGSWNNEKRRIQWKMDDLDITSSRMAKILARWQVESIGEAQPVSVSWRLPGRLASRIGIQLLDDVHGTSFQEVARATQSGKYIAQP